MKTHKYRITKHAALRMAQRNISIGDLAIVFKYGRKRHCTNATIFFLGKKNLPKGTEKDLARLVGTFAVVVNDRVMTVIRNRTKGSKKINLKPKCPARKDQFAGA